MTSEFQITGSRNTKANRKRWKAKLLLVLLPSILLLGIAEVALRLYGRFPPTPRIFVGERANRESKNFVVDEHTGWRMTPNHEIVKRWEGREVRYHSNSQGFRSEVDFDPADARRKIAIIGDSHCFGVGLFYEETFASLLQESSPGTVVHNFAMPGFGIDQMWLSLKHQALGFHPDQVICGIYSADFERSESAYRDYEGFNKPLYLLQDDELVLATVNDKPSSAIRYLEGNSYVWAAGRIALRWIGMRWPVGNYWHLNQAFLDEMQKECAAAQVELVFLYIPYRSFKHNSMLRRYMLETKAQFVDLSDETPEDPNAYFFQDGHLNAAGHRLVARRLGVRSSP